jgi:CRISPR-associated protein Cmx8
MSKAATSIDSVCVTYDLLALPTAQHKAGLAGLLLLIEDMRERGLAEESIPAVEEQTAQTARVRFTAPSVQGIFNDLYDARVVEVAVAQRWAGAEVKREDVVEVTDEKGKVSRQRRFVYDVVQPCGTFLRNRYPDGDGRWLKLWREMLWAVPRSKPMTRIPFNQRAAGADCAEGKAAWKELQRVEQYRQRNSFRTEEVAGALLLGAQAQNAEGIAFEGRSEENLLLHFWPLTVLTFVPQQIQQDGEGEFVGYLLTIPEVANLLRFGRLYKRMLQQLPTDARGYRPAAAVIDLPAQGALEFLCHLDRLAQELMESKEVAYAVSAIEYFHMDKLGNNVKTMAGGRVAPRPGLLGAYRGVLKDFHNPLFRAAGILALLRDQNWYDGMGALFAQRPRPFFVRSTESPRMPLFGTDAGRAFEIISQTHQSDLEAQAMNNAVSETTTGGKPNTPLESIVYRLVRTYVQRKTEDRCGIRWQDFKDRKVKDEKTGKERTDIPQEYRDAREKVCSDAFLALRSRREQDFVDYFTTTICQVAQFLPEDDYRVLAESLICTPEHTRWEDVKTLALLALSANS